MEFRWIDCNINKVRLHGVTPEEAQHVVETATGSYPQYRNDAKFTERERRRWQPAARAGRIMSGTRKSKSIAGLRGDELDAFVAEFDREFIADSFGPMTGEARRRHLRAKRKRGRPQVGSGSRRISVTVEQGLLKKADRLAKRLGVSRAKLIAVGLWKVIGAAEGS